LQISIDPQFNYDSQLQDLRNDVKKIKQVGIICLRVQGLRMLPDQRLAAAGAAAQLPLDTPSQ
jgi:hypothetical protein